MRTFSVPEQILRPLFIFFLVCFLFGFLLAYILYLLGLTSATNSSHIAVFSIEISFFFLLLISFLQSKYENAEPGSLEEHQSFSVRVVHWWLPFSILIRFVWEFGWCVCSFYLSDLYGIFFLENGNTPLAREQAYALMEQHKWTWFFVVYGVADARYLVGDSFVFSLELLVSIFGGLVSIYALYLSKNKRHAEAAFYFIYVAAVESFGTFLYFLTEVYNKFYFLDTENPMNWFFKFFGLNFLWIIAYFIVLAHELRKMRKQDAMASCKFRPVRQDQ